MVVVLVLVSKMESSFVKSAVPFSYCCWLLLFLFNTVNTIVVVNGLEEYSNCEFPAIFNFGDSNSDTGGLTAAFPRAVSQPYGDTYFHEPAGRYSDGRVIIDFIAESFNLPYLSAYLDSLGTNFKHGANFATSASTIRLPDRVLPVDGGFSPFYLDQQYSQFTRLLRISTAGKIDPKIVPEKDYFKRALYTFDIGHNDITQGFFGNLSIHQVNESIPDIINTFSTDFKNIYNTSGGGSFWIHNTGPVGCLPYILTKFPSAERDEAGCSMLHNDVVKYFNYQLKQAVLQLRKDLPLAAVTYVDIYSAKYTLYTEPQTYGLEKPLIACCGYGGKYNYNSKVGCGGTVKVNNGSQFIYVGSCESPWGRVNWDGIHYTEAANKAVFDKISTGAFSDPPLPLKMACHKSPM